MYVFDTLSFEYESLALPQTKILGSAPAFVPTQLKRMWFSKV